MINANFMTYIQKCPEDPGKKGKFSFRKKGKRHKGINFVETLMTFFPHNTIKMLATVFYIKLALA